MVKRFTSANLFTFLSALKVKSARLGRPLGCCSFCDFYRQQVATKTEEIRVKVMFQSCNPTDPGLNLDHTKGYTEIFRCLFLVSPHKFKECTVVTCFDILRLHQIIPLSCRKPNQTIWSGLVEPLYSGNTNGIPSVCFEQLCLQEYPHCHEDKNKYAILMLNVHTIYVKQEGKEKMANLFELYIGKLF
jgi:hypothetical protein